MRRKSTVSLDFESMERRSHEERKKYLEGLLPDFINFAYNNAPGVKKRFDEAGVDPAAITHIEDLEKVPVLRKDDLLPLQRANPPFGGLITVPVEELPKIYISPGPIFDPFHVSEAFWQRQAHAFKAMGFRKGDIVVNTFAYHLVLLGHMIERIYRLVGAVVVPMGVGNTELQVEVTRQLKATVFAGTAGFFMNVVNKAEEMGYDIRKDFNLRLILAGGEMGGGPLRAMIEEKYGLPTRDIYGTSETSGVSYQCDQKRMHIHENIIMEIVDPETGKVVGPGEVGEIVVTSLDDDVFPLIRMGTGDLTAISYEPCPCGRTSPTMTRVLGRVGEAVRTRGMFIHPRQLEQAMAQFPEISSYQGIVTRPGHRDEFILEAELKTEEGINKENLTERLLQVVTEVVRVKLDRVEFVPTGQIPKERKLVLDKRVY